MRGKKLTIEFIKKQFEKENYTLISKEYINAHYKLEYICSNGHKHSITWNDWRKKRRCPICWDIKFKDNGNPNYKGGVTKRKVPLYNTFNFRIAYCEETRRDPNDLDLLQVKCIKCKEWFTPTRNQVTDRIHALQDLPIESVQESRFYCSDECKILCPIFKKYKYSREEKPVKKHLSYTSSELKIWSQEVLKRSDYICEYCGGLATEAHHIQPKKLEPFYALDPDNGIACCEICHYKYAHKDACSTGMLSKINCS